MNIAAKVFFTGAFLFATAFAVAVMFGESLQEDDGLIVTWFVSFAGGAALMVVSGLIWIWSQ